MLPPPCSRQAWETPAGEIKPQTHLLLSTPLPPGLNYAQKRCWPGRGLSPCEGWAEAGLGHWGTGALGHRSEIRAWVSPLLHRLAV